MILSITSKQLEITKNFVKVSETLYTSKPLLTKKIKRLKDKLDIILINKKRYISLNKK